MAGLVVGLLVQQLAHIRQRTASLVVFSLVIGLVASYISGELFVSWLYLIFDAIQALIAAIGAVFVAIWWQRRSGYRR